MFNPATGEFDDDEHPLGGDIGEQAGAPFNPMPPPPSQAPGPEAMPIPAGPPPAPPGVPAPSPMPAPTPAVTPYQPQALPPIPQSRAVSPAEAQNLAAIDQNTAAREKTVQDQQGLREQGATANAQAGERQQFLADAFLQERNRIADEAAKRLQERQKQADADYQAFKAFGIKDPEAGQGFATRILKAIAVGMGGYASGMNGGPNQALQIIQQANADNIARQKAQQEKLFQVAQKSGKDVGEAKQERDDAFRQLDLKHSAMLESSAAMLRSELGRIGIPQAQIDANKDVQRLEQEALGIRQRTLAGIRDDEVSLAKSDIAAAARRHAKAAGAGGGGAGAMDARSQLSEYAQAHPGDTPGLYRLAAKIAPTMKQKDVDSIINQNKVPEGAGKSAQQGAVALRAIDTIEKLNYKPTREDVQRFLQNGREMEQARDAAKRGVVQGFLAGKAQQFGMMAQGQFEGLNPKARQYFENVVRYMESIGREQSGAAISQSEWDNFYGQYGPQSAGGLEAARQYARDKLKLSGTAGRVLEKNAGSLPQASAPGGGGGPPRQESDAVKQARQIVNDPDAAKRAAKARGMTETQVKAAAELYLRQNKAADIVL